MTTGAAHDDPAAGEGAQEEIALDPTRAGGVFGFGAADMILLANAAGPHAARRAAAAFRFDPKLVASEEATMAAVSSLAARGFLELDELGRPVRPVHAARGICVAIADARRWTLVLASGPAGPGAFRILRGPQLAIIVQQGSFGAFHVGFVDPAETDADIVLGMLDDHLETSPGATFTVVVEASGAAARIVRVRRTGGDEGEGPRFRVERAEAADDEAVAAPGGPLDEDGLEALIAELLPPIEGRR